MRKYLLLALLDLSCDTLGGGNPLLSLVCKQAVKPVETLPGFCVEGGSPFLARSRRRDAYQVSSGARLVSRLWFLPSIVRLVASSIVSVVRALDSFLENIAAGREAYDGIVTESSQTYPQTPGGVIRNAHMRKNSVSHVGVQSSVYVANQVDDWVRYNLNITPVNP